MITKIPSSFLSKRTTPFLTRGIGAHVFVTRRTLQSSIPRAAAMAAPQTASRHHHHPEWSGSLSHATPEADFTALHVSANSATMESEWSQELSFAAPESDFTSTTTTRDNTMANRNTRNTNNNANDLHLHVSANAATMESEWAHEILLRNAQQDVAALQAALETPAQKVDDDDDKAMMDRMLYQWTLSSPESAIGCTHVAETMNEATRNEFGSILQTKGLSTTEPSLPSEASSRQTNPTAMQLNAADVDRMMQQLQVACPESAVGFVHVAEFLTHTEQQQLKSLFQGKEMPSVLPSQQEETTNQNKAANMDLMMQHQLFSCPESATGFVHVAETMTSEERHDFITALKQQHQHQQSLHPLPTTYQQALQDPYHRAIVITTAEPPFRVVHVNDVWEGLCGFTQQEAHDQPIGKLLQGPETQAARTRQLVQQVLEQPNQQQTVQLINYTKNGRKFYNQLHFGALRRADATTTTSSSTVDYLIGVLTEVDQPEQQQQEEKGQKMVA